MREIITLSFGKESNYLQTHFWNIEDEALKNKSQKLQEKGTEGDALFNA